MMTVRSSFASKLTALWAILFVLAAVSAFGQSRPQRPDPAKETLNPNQKRNTRPDPKAEEQKRLEEEEKNAVVFPDVEKVETELVNVDAVVYNKKTKQILTGLKKENFAVFENGVKQDISVFSEPESPITVTVVLEYSKWTEIFGSAAGGWFEPGIYEAIRPVAQFVSGFIKPPDDYASVIAFDMRPTPITDFTNDPNRLRQTVDLLLRNRPAYRDNNLFDALKFALVGGKGDAVVLENSGERMAEYGGMVDVKSKRRAIILVASGINTFSRTGYGDVRKIIQEAGVPIYIISTGNLFFKKYEHRLPAMDDITGAPGRLTFLQAKNTMNTFAKESGGAHFEMTFEGEIPGYLQAINAMLRSQYNLAYDLGEGREPGKKYKLEVKVDVDGDGTFDDKTIQVQHRPYYSTPKEEGKKK